MTNFMFTVIVVIVLAVIILFGTVFGKQLRVKMKGRTDEVMRQDAQTPEGARDYYNAAIEKKKIFTIGRLQVLLKFPAKDLLQKMICIRHGRKL